MSWRLAAPRLSSRRAFSVAVVVARIAVKLRSKLRHHGRDAFLRPKPYFFFSFPAKFLLCPHLDMEISVLPSLKFVKFLFCSHINQ